MRQGTDRCRFWTCLVGVLVLLAAPAEAQRWRDKDIEVTVGSGAGKTLDVANTDGDIGPARFTKATLPFPGVEGELVYLTNGAGPADCCGGGDPAPPSETTKCAVGFDSSDYLVQCVFRFFPGKTYGRYWPQGAPPARSGLLTPHNWSNQADGTTGGHRTAAEPVFVLANTFVQTGGAMGNRDDLSIITSAGEIPASQGDYIGYKDTDAHDGNGITSFSAGCSEPLGERVIECVKDSDDEKLHRCSDDPWDECSLDSDCAGTCDFHATVGTLKGIQIAFHDASADRWYMQYASSFVNNTAADGQFTLAGGVKFAMTAGDGWMPAFDQTGTHLTRGGYRAWARFALKQPLELAAARVNLIPDGGMEVDCGSFEAEDGADAPLSLISADYDPEQPLSFRAIYGKGCRVNSGFDSGAELFTKLPFQIPDIGQAPGTAELTCAGVVFATSATQTHTFSVLDASRTSLIGTQAWYVQTEDGGQLLPGRTTRPGGAVGPTVFVGKISGATAGVDIHLEVEATTGTGGFGFDMFRCAPTPLSMQGTLALHQVLPDGIPATVAVIGDSYAGTLEFTGAVNDVLKNEYKICGLTDTDPSPICEHRVPMTTIEMLRMNPGWTAAHFADLDGFSACMDWQPDIALFILGQNDVSTTSGTYCDGSPCADQDAAVAQSVTNMKRIWEECYGPSRIVVVTMGGWRGLLAETACNDDKTGSQKCRQRRSNRVTQTLLDPWGVPPLP